MSFSNILVIGIVFTILALLWWYIKYGAKLQIEAIFGEGLI